MHRSAPRFSRGSPTHASLDPAAAHRFLQLLPTRGHTYEDPVLASAWLLPLSAVGSKSPSLSPFSFRKAAPSPSRGRIAKAASRDSPSKVEPTTLQGRRQPSDLGNHRPITAPLAGDTSTRPSLATTVVGRWCWTARAEQPRSKGPRRTACCRRTGRVEVPLLMRAARAPLFQDVIDPSSGGLEGPFVLMNRPRPPLSRRPAKGNGPYESRGAFHRSESIEHGDRSPRRGPTSPLRRQPRFLRG